MLLSLILDTTDICALVLPLRVPGHQLARQKRVGGLA